MERTNLSANAFKFGDVASPKKAAVQVCPATDPHKVPCTQPPAIRPGAEVVGSPAPDREGSRKPCRIRGSIVRSRYAALHLRCTTPRIKAGRRRTEPQSMSSYLH